MKRLLLLVFLFPLISFSQCPPDYTFSSQAEIDAFAIDYPDCTLVSDLLIEGDDITDLSGLAQIVRCKELSISNNPIITNLDGLYPNLQVGGNYEYSASVSINNNASLTSISALSEIYLDFYDHGTVEIEGNPSLTGLEGIEFVSNGCCLIVVIANNDALTNLVGFSNFENQEALGISGNDNLIDFTGLGNASDFGVLSVSNNASLQSFNGANFNDNNFETISIRNNPNLTDINSGFGENNSGAGFLGNNLVIKDNLNLSVCNVEVICGKLSGDYDSGMMFFDIQNNAPGCNSIQEIEYSCGMPPSNDDCAFGNYDDIIANNYPMWLELGQTVTAIDEFATESTWYPPSCNDVDVRKDLWFFFNSGENTTIDLITDLGYSLQLWEGGCMSIVQVENACDSNVLADIPVTTNTLYSVQVWNNVSGRVASGSGWFNISAQDGLLSTPEFEFDEISIYPNPAQNELHIQSNLPIDLIQMFNLLGQQVLESKATTLDVSNLMEGLYIVKVISNKKESTYKIVKQ